MSVSQSHKALREFAFINMARALAAFWVLVYHCSVWSNWGTEVVPAGKIAVDLFMMISGFLMAANAQARDVLEPLADKRNWLTFWLRRLFRIAPVYYASLGVALLFYPYFPQGYIELQSLNPAAWPSIGADEISSTNYTLTNLAVHLSFLFGLFPQYASSTLLPDWSLGLEMQFYVVFPALFLAMRRWGHVRVGLLVGLPLFVAGYLLSKKVAYSQPSLLVFKLNYFLAGILLQRALAFVQDRRLRLIHLASAALLVSLDVRYHAQLILLPCLVLGMYKLGASEIDQSQPRWLKRITTGRWTRFASDSSYSVYLFHGFFISAFGLLLGKMPGHEQIAPATLFISMIVFVTLLSYLTARLTYRFIEVPGIKLGTRFVARLAQRDRPSPGTVLTHDTKQDERRCRLP